jgi:hypothetical protein
VGNGKDAIMYHGDYMRCGKLLIKVFEEFFVGIFLMKGVGEWGILWIYIIG